MVLKTSNSRQYHGSGIHGTTQSLAGEPNAGMAAIDDALVVYANATYAPGHLNSVGIRVDRMPLTVLPAISISTRRSHRNEA